MAKRRKKRNPIMVISNIVIVTALLLIVVALIYRFYGKHKIVEAVSEKTMETVLESSAREMGVKEEKVKSVVKEIEEKIEEEDKEAVVNIIENHVNPELIKKGTEYIQNGDTNGLKEYAKSQLSEEETRTLMEMYEKYKDKIDITDYLNK